MSFASLTFLVFFLSVLAMMSLTNIPCLSRTKHIRRTRQCILLIASYIFYGAWDWRFCFLMLFVTITAYCSACGLKGSYRKVSIVVGVVCPLLVLGVFKYYNFFLESFCQLLQIKNDYGLKIILPVGISFYTFQALSYVIDVDRKKVEYESSLLQVALYISFFPQLVAGPIVKSREFLPQLKEDRTVSLKNLETGIQIFLVGLFKKIVLADHLSVFVDEVFSMPEIFNGGTVILAVISYSFQIYFDFSGYSDMAIGSAKCFGYDLSKNFNLPYLSRNISEFWRRWHISLSTWLKEYLYIPLGGNRKGQKRTYINLFFTMVLGGLWHGAAWNFVIWGGLHGIALCIHKFVMKRYENVRRKPVFQGFNMVVTYAFVSFCWIFFRSDNLESAFAVLKQCFVWDSGVQHYYSWSIVTLAIVAVWFLLIVFQGIRKKQCSFESEYVIMNLNRVSSLVILFVFAGLIIGLAYMGSNPFVYFQF